MNRSRSESWAFGVALVGVLLFAPAPPATAANEPDSVASMRPLSEILRDLGRGTARVVWSSRLVAGNLVAPRPDPSLPLAEQLEALLAPLGLAAVEGPAATWTVVRRDDPAALVVLRIRVTSRPSGRAVAGALVEVAPSGAEDSGHPVRATADDHGSVRLERLVPGRLTVTASPPRAGFRGDVHGEVSVLPGGSGKLDLELDELPVTSERIVVTPSRTSLLRDDAPGATDLRRDQIERLPHLGDDLFRAAAHLPGATANDFSAEVGLRGGEAREVSLRVDGLEIPKPWHLPDLQNLFGIVDSAIVDSLDLYSGGFPVEFGNAQSGVLDARTRTPSSPHLLELGISFLTARALAGGSFERGGGWLVAGRRGYLDLILEQVDAQGKLRPVYSDLFAKLERTVGRKTLVALETFGLDDHERYVSDDPGQEALEGRARGASVWLRLDTGWREHAWSRTVFGWNRRSNRRSGFTNDGISTLDDRRAADEATASQDWSWELRAGHRLKAGWIETQASADYDFDSLHSTRDPVILRGGPPIVIVRSAHLRPRGHAEGVYFADRWSPVDKFALEAGARWDRQSWTGESQVAPRVQLLWRLGARSEVRAAWGRYDQAQRLDELQVEDGVDVFHPAEEAVHRVLGFSQDLGRGGRLRIEAYEKLLSHPASRFENLFDPIQLFPSIEDDRVEVAPDRARVRGVESAWSVRPGRRTTLELSYVWSRAEDHLDGRWTPRRFDQTHAATAIFGFLPNERWSVELVATYHTGWPTTSASLALVPGPDGTPVLGVVLGPFDGERYPAYERLDARVRRSRATENGVFDFYFEVFNLLNRDNACCVDSFELVPNGTAVPELRRKLDSWLPLVPSFGLVWRRR